MTDTVRAPAAATAQGPRTSDRLGGTINPKHTDTAPPNQEFAGLPRRAVRRHRGGRPMSAYDSGLFPGCAQTFRLHGRGHAIQTCPNTRATAGDDDT